MIKPSCDCDHLHTYHLTNFQNFESPEMQVTFLQLVAVGEALCVNVCDIHTCYFLIFTVVNSKREDHGGLRLYLYIDTFDQMKSYNDN